MKKFFVLVACLFAVGQARARSIECNGVVYQSKTSLTSVEPEVFKEYGMDADLYMTINQSFNPARPLYVDLQKIDEKDTAASLELTYAWCPKTASLFKCGAIRVLKIDKQTGDAQFFNNHERFTFCGVIKAT